MLLSPAIWITGTHYHWNGLPLLAFFLNVFFLNYIALIHVFVLYFIHHLSCFYFLTPLKWGEHKRSHMLENQFVAGSP